MTYQIFIQNGNENFGTEGSTVYVAEKLQKLRKEYIANRIHEKNKLVPIQVIDDVLSNFVTVTAEAMAEGMPVQLTDGDDVMIRIYPDMSIKGGNINLERAKELIPGLTEITPENAAELVQKAGIQLRVKVESQAKFLELVKSFKPTMESTGYVIVKDKVLKSNADNTEPTIDSSTGNTGTIDSSTGGNDGMD